MKLKQNMNLVQISTKCIEIFKNLQPCPIGNVPETFTTNKQFSKLD